jgi:hypothetical protein
VKTTFQLVINHTGHVILATTERLSPEVAERIKASFDEWREAQPPHVLIIPDTEVIRVTEIELDLATPAEGE